MSVQVSPQPIPNNAWAENIADAESGIRRPDSVVRTAGGAAVSGTADRKEEKKREMAWKELRQVVFVDTKVDEKDEGKPLKVTRARCSGQLNLLGIVCL
jgi:hypothetical protein